MPRDSSMADVRLHQVPEHACENRRGKRERERERERERKREREREGEGIRARRLLCQQFLYEINRDPERASTPLRPLPRILRAPGLKSRALTPAECNCYLSDSQPPRATPARHEHKESITQETRAFSFPLSDASSAPPCSLPPFSAPAAFLSSRSRWMHAARLKPRLISTRGFSRINGQSFSTLRRFFIAR